MCICITEFEGDNLLAQAMSFYIAGFEATATSLSTALLHLGRHPDYQTTLYNEIKEHLSGKEISMELLSELPFLDCVINETLRLSPPIPVVDRIAEDDFKVSTKILRSRNIVFLIYHICSHFSCQIMDC